MKPLLGLTVALALMAHACGAQSRPETHDGATSSVSSGAHGDVLMTSAHLLFSVGWDTDTSLVVETQQGYGSSIEGVDLRSGSVRTLVQPADRGCFRVDTTSPTYLSPSRVAVVLSCSSKTIDGWQNTLGVLDTRNGGIRVLAHGELDAFGQPIQATELMSIDDRGAIIDTGDASCGTIFAWDSSGSHPIKLRVGRDRLWSLAADLRPSFAGPRCTQLGVARWATLARWISRGVWSEGHRRRAGP